MAHTEAIMCLPQTVTLRGCEEKMGDHSRGVVKSWNPRSEIPIFMSSGYFGNLRKFTVMSAFYFRKLCI